MNLATWFCQAFLPMLVCPRAKIFMLFVQFEMNHENFIFEISSPVGVPTRSAMDHENCCLEEAEKAML